MPRPKMTPAATTPARLLTAASTRRRVTGLNAARAPPAQPTTLKPSPADDRYAAEFTTRYQ